jgi:AraC family transcriptional regulator, arabinose operon regulatory protein
MDRRVELVISRMEAAASRAWTTAQLAALVNLSPSRFRHLFKEETGKTTTQYLRELRLQRAEFLLRTTFLSIKEVMNAAGVTSMSHFVQYFKQRHGETPTAYRTRLRGQRKK